jgi:hypothetical protein
VRLPLHHAAQHSAPARARGAHTAAPAALCCAAAAAERVARCLCLPAAARAAAARARSPAPRCRCRTLPQTPPGTGPQAGAAGPGGHCTTTQTRARQRRPCCPAGCKDGRRQHAPHVTERPRLLLLTPSKRHLAVGDSRACAAPRCTALLTSPGMFSLRSLSAPYASTTCAANHTHAAADVDAAGWRPQAS